MARQFNKLKASERDEGQKRVFLTDELQRQAKETAALQRRLSAQNSSDLAKQHINKTEQEAAAVRLSEMEEVLRQEREDWTLKTQELEDELSRLRQALGERERYGKAMAERIDEVMAFEQSQRDLQREIRRGLQKNLSSKEEKQKGLRGRVEDMMERMGQMRREAEEERASGEGWQEEKRGLLAEKERVEGEGRRAREEGLRLSKIVEDLRGILEEESKKGLDMRGEVDGARSRVKKTEKRLKEAESVISRLRETVGKLESERSELKVKNEEARQMERGREEMEREKETWRMKAIAEEIECGRLKLKIEKSGEERREHGRGLETLQERLAEAERETVEAESRTETSRAELAQMETSFFGMEIELKRLESRNEMLEAREVELKTVKRESEERIRRLEEELRRDRERHSAAEAKSAVGIEAAESEREEMAESLREGKEEMMNALNERQELVDNVEDLKGRLAEMSREMGNMERERERLGKHAEEWNQTRLSRNLEHHRAKMAETELSELREKNEQLVILNSALRHEKTGLGETLVLKQKKYHLELQGALESLRLEQRSRNEMDLELRHKERTITMLETKHAGMESKLTLLRKSVEFGSFLFG